MTGYNGNIKATKSDKDALEWQFSQVFGERMPGEEIQEGEAPCTSVYCVFIGVIRYLAGGLRRDSVLSVALGLNGPVLLYNFSALKIKTTWLH